MSPNPPKNYGLAGLGCTNRFDVEIDEALDEPGDTLMSIHARSWSFQFGLAAREEVARMLSFLREHAGRLMFAELGVGSFHGAPVSLVKDDEFGDRFYLKAFGSGHLLSFVIAGDDLAEFTDAVAQAVEDLQS
jgi:hypothetical protein